jgi:adenylosuccinate synthase
LNGWEEDLTKAKSMKDLPKAAQDYVALIGAELGIPIDVVSVGPSREQTLWIRPLFN